MFVLPNLEEKEFYVKHVVVVFFVANTSNKIGHIYILPGKPPKDGNSISQCRLYRISGDKNKNGEF